MPLAGPLGGPSSQDVVLIESRPNRFTRQLIVWSANGPQDIHKLPILAHTHKHVRAGQSTYPTVTNDCHSRGGSSSSITTFSRA
jgi:hypothetical protein